MLTPQAHCLKVHNHRKPAHLWLTVTVLSTPAEMYSFGLTEQWPEAYLICDVLTFDLLYTDFSALTGWLALVRQHSRFHCAGHRRAERQANKEETEQQRNQHQSLLSDPNLQLSGQGGSEEGRGTRNTHTLSPSFLLVTKTKRNTHTHKKIKRLLKPGVVVYAFNPCR